MELLDLVKAKDSPVQAQGVPGGISGGEKRRLLIACESLHRPSLLLLDEPTSGLDASTALLVVKLLRAMADGEDVGGGESRPAVVLSIHQPRAAIPPLFDNMMLLAEGKEIFLGPTWQAARGGGGETRALRDGVLGYLNGAGYRCPAFESPTDFILDLVNTRDDDAAKALELDEAKSAGGSAAEDGMARRSATVAALAERWAASAERAKASSRRAAGTRSLPAALGGGGDAGSRAGGGRSRDVLGEAVGAHRAHVPHKLREPLVVATQGLNSCAGRGRWETRARAARARAGRRTRLRRTRPRRARARALPFRC